VVALGYVLAFVIGLTLGMLGGGGSILTVPVFVYVLGIDPKLAIAMSLPVVGTTSLVGAIGHWRAGNVRVRTALPFGLVAMAGAFTAARLSVRLAGRTQLFVLGTTMLVAATFMLVGAPGTRGGDAGGAKPAPLPLFLAVGFAVGGLTGVIGIGGGFLIVPALVVLAQVPMRQAVGTSLLVITMNSLAGFAGQAHVGEIPLGVVITFTIIAIGGILVGTRLVRSVKQAALKRAFAVLLLVIAVLLLWQNRGML